MHPIDDFVLTLARRVYLWAMAVVLALLVALAVPSGRVDDAEWVIAFMLTVVGLLAVSSAWAAVRGAVLPLLILGWSALLYFTLTQSDASDWIALLAIPLVVGPVFLVAAVVAQREEVVEREASDPSPSSRPWGARVTNEIISVWTRRNDLIADAIGAASVFLLITMFVLHWLR